MLELQTRVPPLRPGGGEIGFRPRALVREPRHRQRLRDGELSDVGAAAARVDPEAAVRARLDRRIGPGAVALKLAFARPYLGGGGAQLGRDLERAPHGRLQRPCRDVALGCFRC